MQRRCTRLFFLAIAVSLVAACGDSDDETAAASEPANHPPVISGKAATTVVEGELYSFKPTASDPDGDALVFSVTGKPSWMEFDPETGELTGRPNENHRGKHKGIIVSVSDGELEDSLDPIEVDVVPASTDVNQPPAISGTPATSVIVGDFYDFIPTAVDPDGDALTFAVTGLPSWADFDPVIGRVSGMPASADVGVYGDIVISVSDGIASTALDAFAIAVNAPPIENQPPMISGVPAPSVLAGTAYSFTPTVSDPERDPLQFTIFGQPGWASFDADTGTLSGTPSTADVGRYASISIFVTDGESSVGLAPFSIDVISPNQAPTISGSPGTSATVGEAYSFIPTASDPDGDTLSFSIVGQPSWAAFNTVNGALTGTPGSGDVGNHDGISITVSDGEAEATLGPFSIGVDVANQAPVISGSPATSVIVGQPYSFVPTASDPDGDTLSFSIVGQPSWTAFDPATGGLQGTPGSGAVGNYTGISITVTDGEAQATLGPFSISVIAGNAPPVISGSPGTSATVGEAYGFTPTASDPDGDTLSFSIVGQPSWASFDPVSGTLAGTPGAADEGSYSGIAITVSDGEFESTLGPFSVAVNAVATGAATLSWTAPTENTDGTLLDDLAGFVVYWGTAPGNYTSSVSLDNPGLTSYVVDNLTSGQTYYFATTAYNSQNVESSFSNEASKTIP